MKHSDSKDAIHSSKAMNLNAMSLKELEEAHDGLKEMPLTLENASGVCVVLHGLILKQIKSRLPHGEWIPWLKKRWKTGARDAQKRMHLGEIFSKSAMHGAFEQLSLDFIDENQPLSLNFRNPIIKEIFDFTKGRSYSRLLGEETGDGRAKNPGGFRPNWEKLRDWLMEKYPERIELLDVELFSDFPPDIQARFKKEGPRYKCRLTKEQRETIEKARRAQNWCAAAVPALHGAIDDDPYVVADDDLLMQIETALKDLLNGVQMHRRSRKGKLSLN